MSLIGTSQFGSESFMPPRPRRLQPAADRSGPRRSSSSASTCTSASPSRCCRRSWPASSSSPSSTWPSRRRAAGAGPAAVRGGGGLRLRPQLAWAATSSAAREFLRFVPYLVTVFFFILVNNLFGHHSVHRSSRRCPARAWSTAWPLLSWLIYNYVGIKKHGFLGYFKHQSVPAGVTGPILLLIIPLEFMSNILVRPVTLALRLFANMFAGHLLLILFAARRRVPLTHMAIQYAAGRHPRLAAVHRGRLPRDPDPVPAGLRVRPAERHVHPGRARRRALT